MKFEITAFIADLFNSFCKEVYEVAFFKVVQQQTIVKWEIQLFICGEIISVCNSERIIKIGQFCEVMLKQKSPVFNTHSVLIVSRIWSIERYRFQ